MTYPTTLTKSDTAYILRTLQESLSQTYPPDSLTIQALDTAYEVLLHERTEAEVEEDVEDDHGTPVTVGFLCSNCKTPIMKTYYKTVGKGKARFPTTSKYCPLCGAKIIWP